jgi:hypothetical protein
LTHPWAEQHKVAVAKLSFPRTDAASEEAQLWATLAAEIGANAANWVANKDNSIPYPASEFGNARRLAYALSQKGRGALDAEACRTVFETGEIGPELEKELLRRRDLKQKLGHVESAPRK